MNLKTVHFLQSATVYFLFFYYRNYIFFTAVIFCAINSIRKNTKTYKNLVF